LSRDRGNYRPTLEALDVKLALSGANAAIAGPAAGLTIQPQARSDQNTYETLVAFTQAYPSTFGGPRYNPDFDLNHNGRVGQTDGKMLLKSLPPLSRKVPISLNLRIARRDRVNGHHPTNSGGVTHSRVPTVIGHTTPGAIIFTGTGTTDIKLKGPAYVADANGNFSFKIKLDAGINQLDLQAFDPYGQQKLRAFPIYWTTFRAYQMKHPRNL
jgi:hypothetical protein